MALGYIKLTKLELEFSRIYFSVWFFISAEHRIHMWFGGWQGGQQALPCRPASCPYWCGEARRYEVPQLRISGPCACATPWQPLNSWDTDVGSFVLLNSGCPLRLHFALVLAHTQHPFHATEEANPTTRCRHQHCVGDPNSGRPKTLYSSSLTWLYFVIEPWFT